MTGPIIDRSATRAALAARYRDEHAGPPEPGDVAVRCTRHGTFIEWAGPPAVSCRTACPASCAGLS